MLFGKFKLIYKKERLLPYVTAEAFVFLYSLRAFLIGLSVKMKTYGAIDTGGSFADGTTMRQIACVAYPYQGFVHPDLPE